MWAAACGRDTALVGVISEPAPQGTMGFRSWEAEKPAGTGRLSLVGDDADGRTCDSGGLVSNRSAGTSEAAHAVELEIVFLSACHAFSILRPCPHVPPTHPLTHAVRVKDYFTLRGILSLNV